MGIFKRIREKPTAATTQIRSADRHPFGMLENYIPLGGGDTRLYRAMREAVPVLDAAVMKIIRLTGGFYVKCDNARTEYDLNEFLRTVDAGRSQRGINAFLDSYLDSLLTCGRAVGEIVTDGKGFSASELKQFVEYVGRHRSDQGRYTAVENALDEGKITESQANSILAQFGIK